jgi:hypothetical protein
MGKVAPPAALAALAALLALAGLVSGCSHASTPGVSARVILDSRTVPSGAKLTGRVIVDNQTGHALHVHGCGNPVWVDLSSRHFHQGGGAPACADTLTVPVGQTTYPVQVRASYLACSVGQADGDTPKCGPGYEPPALPAGVYQAALGATAGFVLAPPPIEIHVTPPAG